MIIVRPHAFVNVYSGDLHSRQISVRTVTDLIIKDGDYVDVLRWSYSNHIGTLGINSMNLIFTTTEEQMLFRLKWL